MLIWYGIYLMAVMVIPHLQVNNLIISGSVASAINIRALFKMR